MTTILINDTRSNGYAGYFAEFPELMAQGETKQEFEDNLLSSLIDILAYRKNQALFSKPAYQQVETLNFV